MARNLKSHYQILNLLIMKALKLSVVMLGMLVSTASFAQDKKTEISKEKKAEMRTAVMAEKLNLTEAQKEKMMVMRKETMDERIKIKNDVNSDEATKKAAMKELRDKNKARTEEILTPEQSAKFSAMKTEARKKHGKKAIHKDGKRRKMMKTEEKAKQIRA